MTRIHKDINSDLNISIRFTDFYLKKNKYLFFFFSLTLFTEPFKDNKVKIIYFFKNRYRPERNSYLYSFWTIFFPIDPDLWIRILLRRIRIQEAKILGIRIPVHKKLWAIKKKVFNTFSSYKYNYRFERPGYFYSFWSIFCSLDPDLGSKYIGDPDPKPVHKKTLSN